MKDYTLRNFHLGAKWAAWRQSPFNRSGRVVAFCPVNVPPFVRNGKRSRSGRCIR